MSIVIVDDSTHKNVGQLPVGVLAALYTTGSSDIKATPQDFANHPNAIHICQDHGSDVTADMLDSESGAANPADCVKWLPLARAAFAKNVRPGQRWPGIYASLSNLPPIANAFTLAKITNVPLWVAEWGLPQVSAISDITNASGPWPIVGMQIKNLAAFDFSLFSSTWLGKVSGVAAPTIPPGQWRDPKEWTWKSVTLGGVGLDNAPHAFTFDVNSGQWVKV